MKAAAHRRSSSSNLLEDAGIKCDVENSYLSFLRPTATNTFIKVDIRDEKNPLTSSMNI
jgi:hypothetical protein